MVTIRLSENSNQIEKNMTWKKILNNNTNLLDFHLNNHNISFIVEPTCYHKC